jgi:hypothetical protein
MKVKLEYASLPQPNWTHGIANEYYFCIKHYDLPSPYGIDNGRISKLEIRKNGIIIVNFDRRWEIRPPDEIKEIYDVVLEKFN